MKRIRTWVLWYRSIGAAVGIEVGKHGRGAWASAALAACVVMAPAHANASAECYVSVSQPIFVADCGCYVLGDVTYQESCGWLPPGYEVTLIGRPNAVLWNGRAEERNAAHQEGLKVSADLVSDAGRLPKGQGGEPYLDTLDVRLEVAGAVRRARADAEGYRAGRDSVAALMAAQGDTATARRIRQHREEFPTWRVGKVQGLIRATLDCIVDAASRSRIPIRYVKTTVMGDPGLAKLSRTVAVPRRSPSHPTEY